MSLIDCPGNDIFKPFLAGRLSPPEQEAIELHLIRCRECRRQLVNLYQISKPPATVRAPRGLTERVLRIPAKRRGIIPSLILEFPRRAAAAMAVALLFAAGITALFLFSESRRVRQLPTSGVLRQEAQSVPAPQLLAPSAGAVIATEQIEFRWSKAEGASRYAFTLLDEKGDIVVQTSTTEEHLVLSASSISFERGKPYFWYIEARLPDGIAVESAIGKFAISGGLR